MFDYRMGGWEVSDVANTYLYQKVDVSYQLPLVVGSSVIPVPWEAQ